MNKLESSLSTIMLNKLKLKHHLKKLELRSSSIMINNILMYQIPLCCLHQNPNLHKKCGIQKCKTNI